MAIRQPIISVLGHVDHGKTTLLDFIRGSAIAQKEAGRITQHIGATEVPKQTIDRLCGSIVEKLGFKIDIPGILIIDTPGHEAFTSLRKRGGSISDLAILVVDITQGVQPQTEESIQILKQFRTPFVVALTKIDNIPGWVSRDTLSFAESYEKQPEHTKQAFMDRVYSIIGQLSHFAFDSDLFTNISDYTKKLALIPVSGITGEGVAELLTIVFGLTQKYLKDRLEINPNDKAKGIVLEVKDTRGLGKTVDAIIYDGTLSRGNTIVIASVDKPIVTRVKILLRPKPLSEMREGTSKFVPVDSVSASAGVKIVPADIEGVIAGMPFVSTDDVESTVNEMKADIQDILHTDSTQGVVVKADSLGSIEAIRGLLDNAGINYKKLGVGFVRKQDILEAKLSDKYERVVFAFNVDVPDDVRSLADKEGVMIFKADVVYKIIEDYVEWKRNKQELEKRQELSSLVRPTRIRVLHGHVFRQSKPAIVGVEVLCGRLVPHLRLLNAAGKEIGEIRQIQDQGQNVSEAMSGAQVAVSIDGAVVGRHFSEG
ncbi:MAG TPA: translation initiation factor IF-2, partial [Euryarchaeota archaeon]|nr:translation initiation factor IF-2 [Euryarchaeota archaeon]